MVLPDVANRLERSHTNVWIENGLSDLPDTQRIDRLGEFVDDLVLLVVQVGLQQLIGL